MSKYSLMFLMQHKVLQKYQSILIIFWNAELSGYWSYLSLGPRCVPSVFAGVWACISINATFIGITRDSDDFPLNVTVFHIKKNIRNYYILKIIICYHDCNKLIISCTFKIFQLLSSFLIIFSSYFEDLFSTFLSNLMFLNFSVYESFPR